ncbi:roadblock/LC7 domain-containing protein [Vitreoscilla stercoraria]|uniref:Roadblock/LC7 domain-containing protein n=1 Tax=Vitreoscilla stercoraria TaxID=61 RepID=A0ABY4EHX1_VITST|nr:roadblock/LC7 domain-containing protein [Vitreoscilla stercoraria]UOO92982.1 roadblock/LC7 domain-containing protein [Vitreoscilla stercoraria]
MDNSEAVRKHQYIMARQDMFARHVRALKKNFSDIEFIVIASDDGFPITHTLADDRDAARKAAMCASLGGLSDSVSAESGFNHTMATTIECENGLIFSRRVALDTDKSIEILVACSRTANYATALWTIKKTINDIVEEFNKR